MLWMWTGTNVSPAGGDETVPANSPGEVPKTATELQREHVFIRVMLTFLRAIHAGVVHYKHCIPFLANYTRLIEPFDICSKTIAEILRNEAILAEHSEEVRQVIVAALQDVSTLTPPSSLFVSDKYCRRINSF